MAVALDVPCCRLEFESDDNMRVKTPLLSFTVPAKAKAWRIEFSFVVSPVNEDNDNNKNGDNDANAWRGCRDCDSRVCSVTTFCPSPETTTVMTTTAAAVGPRPRLPPRTRADSITRRAPSPSPLPPHRVRASSVSNKKIQTSVIVFGLFKQTSVIDPNSVLMVPE